MKKEILFPTLIKFFLLLIFLGMCGIACFSCQKEGQPIDISPEEFEAKIPLSSNDVIIDVRTQAEYKQGHLENAELIDMYEAGFKDKIKNLDPDKNYYVYCYSGSRSRSAVKKMRREGINNAYNIKGGTISLSKTNITFIK